RPASEAEDRLVGKHQLVALDRPLQIDLEVEALDDRRVHAGLEDRVAALAAPLCPLDRQVRVAQQRLGLPGPGGDPDADADEELTLPQLERRLERIEQPLRGARGVPGLAKLLEQDRKLVAPQAGDRTREP